MIACITPSGHCIEESSLTLQYASSVMRIKNRPIIQLDPKDQESMDLAQQNKRLRAEVSQLRSLLQAQQNPQLTQMTLESLANEQTGSKILEANPQDQNTCLNVSSNVIHDHSDLEEKYLRLQNEHKIVLKKLENLEQMFIKNEGFEAPETTDVIVSSKLLKENKILKQKLMTMETVNLNSIANRNHDEDSGGVLMAAEEIRRVREINECLKQQVIDLERREKELLFKLDLKGSF